MDLSTPAGTPAPRSPQLAAAAQAPVDKHALTMSKDVTALLTAIRDAVSVPLARLDAADEAARDRLLHERAQSVRIALDGILDRGSGLAGATERLAERTADCPITYTRWVSSAQASGGEA